MSRALRQLLRSMADIVAVVTVVWRTLSAIRIAIVDAAASCRRRFPTLRVLLRIVAVPAGMALQST